MFDPEDVDEYDTIDPEEGLPDVSGEQDQEDDDAFTTIVPEPADSDDDTDDSSDPFATWQE